MPWPDPASLDFNRNRALEQADRYDQSVLRFDSRQDAFHSGQRSTVDNNLVSDPEIRPRRQRQTGCNKTLQRFYLAVLDRNRPLPESDDREDACGDENRQAANCVEPGENVARKERLIHILHPVGPTYCVPVNGHKRLISFSRERTFHHGFAM